MSIFSTAAAQAVTHAAAARRVEARRRAPSSPDAPIREDDEVLIDVQAAVGDDAVRSLKGNADEETSEDRQKADHYQAPKAPANQPKNVAHIDVQG